MIDGGIVGSSTTLGFQRPDDQPRAVNWKTTSLVHNIDDSTARSARSHVVSRIGVDPTAEVSAGRPRLTVVVRGRRRRSSAELMMMGKRCHLVVLYMTGRRQGRN